MIFLHKLLYKNNKIKYWGTIIINLIISILNIGLTVSFYKEKEEVSILVLFLVLQIINIGYYYFFKLYYLKEIYEIEGEELNLFTTNSNSRIKSTILKLSQIILFFIYQGIFSAIMLVIIRPNNEIISAITINYVISIFLFITFCLSKMTYLANYKKSYLDGIANKIIVLSMISAVYIEGYLSIIGVALGLIISIAENFYLIKKGEKLNGEY